MNLSESSKDLEAGDLVYWNLDGDNAWVGPFLVSREGDKAAGEVYEFELFCPNANEFFWVDSYEVIKIRQEIK